MYDSDSILELEGVKRKMKMKALALQGAARQAQVFHILYIIFKEIKAFECIFIFVATGLIGKQCRDQIFLCFSMKTMTSR